MSKSVFVVTKNGKLFTKRNLLAMNGDIQSLFHDKSDLAFYIGNDRKTLIQYLQSKPVNSYLVVIDGATRSYFPNDKYQDVINALQSAKKNDPWAICMALIPNP